MSSFTVGWIGLGRIGSVMAARAASAGFRLRLWARRPEVARDCPVPGEWIASPEELVTGSDIVVTVLGTSADVLDVQRRILPRARPGTVLIDMTTAAPAVALALEAECVSGAVERLDAPVTGGVAGARDGRLTILVGGREATLAHVRPLFDALGNHIVHCGGAGAGYRMKLVNQVAMAGTLLGLVNAAALAEAATFDSALVTHALGAGTASGPLFHAYVPRVLPPRGAVTFTLGMLRKDLELARDELARSDGSTQGCASRFVEFAIGEVDFACARFGREAGVQWLGRAADSGDGIVPPVPSA